MKTMRILVPKKIGVTVLLLCTFLALTGTVLAQEKSGVFESAGTKVNEGPFEFDFDGGVKVVFQELKQGRKSYEHIFSISFLVTSPEDITFKISKDNCVAYDNKGNEFYFYDKWIGNQETYERRIIGDVPTKFGFWFRKDNHELAEIYSRIDVNIMGKVITMRNVPSTK